MKLSDLKKSGHWPTLLTAFLYFDVSFMIWTVLGALGTQIKESLNLSPSDKFLIVSLPILAGSVLRLLLGMLVDRIGAKPTGILAQLVVIGGLTWAWLHGLHTLNDCLILGGILGFAGASFAVALPQAGRWYPPNMQGVVMGLAGAGNVGVVLDHLIAPRLAAAYGWHTVFGFALIPAVAALLLYIIFSKEAPVTVVPKKLSDYVNLLKDKDAHWFCFYYTISFGGFVGLAASFNLYFNSRYGLTAHAAGDLAAFCTLVGALGRPFGGALADKLGGIRALTMFYIVAGCMLMLAAFQMPLWANVALLFIASGAFGMANGSIFQLLPQRFGKDLGVMSGLVGCGGGLGGFMLAQGLGKSEAWFGSYSYALVAFGSLVFCALIGLTMVKHRWRTTWGATAQARI
jgi:MFS transporter, NNP family, nitrate/nitrite transporter